METFLEVNCNRFSRATKSTRCLCSSERPRLCNMRRRNCRRSIQTTRSAYGVLKCLHFAHDCTMTKSVTMCNVHLIDPYCAWVLTHVRAMRGGLTHALWIDVRCDQQKLYIYNYTLYIYNVIYVRKEFCKRIPPPRPLVLFLCPASWKTVLDLTALLLCKIKCSIMFYHVLSCSILELRMRKHAQAFFYICCSLPRQVLHCEVEASGWYRSNHSSKAKLFIIIIPSPKSDCLDFACDCVFALS